MHWTMWEHANAIHSQSMAWWYGGHTLEILVWKSGLIQWRVHGGVASPPNLEESKGLYLKDSRGMYITNRARSINLERYKERSLMGKQGQVWLQEEVQSARRRWSWQKEKAEMTQRESWTCSCKPVVFKHLWRYTPISKTLGAHLLW